MKEIEEWWGQLEIKEEGYYIIRTCKDCKHYEPELDDAGWCRGDIPGVTQSMVPIDFGCIHWTTKEPL